MKEYNTYILEIARVSMTSQLLIYTIYTLQIVNYLKDHERMNESFCH